MGAISTGLEAANDTAARRSACGCGRRASSSLADLTSAQMRPDNNLANLSDPIRITLTFRSNVVAYAGRSNRRERPMPLTEINVTNPNPALASYWLACEAARAAPPPPSWPTVDPGMLEEGRPKSCPPSP